MKQWGNQVYQGLTIDYHMKKSKSKFWLALYFLQPELFCTVQNCVVNTRKLSTIGPLVGGYGAPTLLCTSSYSAMGWGHVVKHHMHNMPSRVNMMKHDTVTTIHLRTTPLCDTNGRTQVIYANVCAHRHA